MRSALETAAVILYGHDCNQNAEALGTNNSKKEEGELFLMKDRASDQRTGSKKSSK